MWTWIRIAVQNEGKRNETTDRSKNTFYAGDDRSGFCLLYFINIECVYDEPVPVPVHAFFR